MPPKSASKNAETTAKRTKSNKKLTKKDTEIFDPEDAPTAEAETKAKKPKLKKAPSQGVPRTKLPRVALPTDTPCTSIVSWNVNGLRAVVKNSPEVFATLVKDEKPDLLFLQETKLQEGHVADFVNLIPGYTSFYTCSTAKKGYSGSAVFIRGNHSHLSKPIPPRLAKGKSSSSSIMDAFKKRKTSFKTANEPGVEDLVGSAEEATPGKESMDAEMDDTDTQVKGAEEQGFKVRSVEYGIGKQEHDQEGRSITVELDQVYVVALYVPNSGQTLQRLDYRLQQWEPALLEYLQGLEKTKPVVMVGDLNVAHLDADIYNWNAKHIKKSAGCTPQERQAFTDFLEQGFVDSFRHLYPDAKGAFTYWSTRKNNRPESKGLRLDYAIMSKALTEPSNAVRLLDSYQLPEVYGSDHCPIGVVLTDDST
eukprot:TRINITY_DN6302_c0_g1_i1.p1 TRINITY_DN6302_c0_g1~~TRINITY_DN6302_c0_g1_i1.p1  ORF type:complete len:445 (+),score=71.76 TRINITY_DN6302_c0_g1_i1:72-1337(+)